MAVIDRRLGFILLGFFLLLAIAVGRAADLGFVRSPSLQRIATSQQVQQVPVPAMRGAITDRHGVELAVSEPADDVTATPYLVKDPLGASQKLAPWLNVSQPLLLQRLTRHGGFVYLARDVPADRAHAAAKLGIDGIGLIPRMKRTYPRDWSASQVLGTVGIDGSGLSGLELSQNSILAGLGGERRVVNDALGQPISVTDVKPARAGAPLTLTLDAAIQDRVEQVLAGVGRMYRPKGATAIVMNPRTGEILALANWPRINANDVGAAPSYATQDRAVGYTYEPGSTFKAITIAAALEEGAVTPDTPFYLPVNLQVADRSLHDAESRGPETRTVAQILQQSSNVGAAEIGLRLGATKFDQWVHRFGFGSPTGIDLPGEERGIVLHRSQYSDSSMANLPIGQGESVTPIQMATAYAAIANGGMLRPPRIIEDVGGKPVPMPRGRRVISPQVAAQLRQMLAGVLAPGGTAHEAAIPGYALAGKTGTANKVDPSTGQYSSSRYVASFVGFVPVNRPQLLVSVMVDEPQGAIYGGVVAAPAFQQIVGFAVPYLGIPPQ